MDDRRIGAALRAIRTRKGWRQVDLARRARVSPPVIGRIERGGGASVPLGKLRRVASTPGARLEVFVRWDGADLPRLLDARHAAMHEAVAGLFASSEGWVIEPEVSFSIHGERGIIDILAWHPGRRMLLVVELKTEVVEVGLLLGRWINVVALPATSLAGWVGTRSRSAPGSSSRTAERTAGPSPRTGPSFDASSRSTVEV